MRVTGGQRSSGAVEAAEGSIGAERPSTAVLGLRSAILADGRFRRRLRRLSSALDGRPLIAPAALSAVPAKSGGRVRLLTLNTAHGRRDATHQALLRRQTTQRNLNAIAAAFRQLAPDVVALQEADGPSAWSGNFDHVAALAELTRLGAHYRGDHNPFGIGRLKLASGTALLARYPLLDPSSHRFAAHGVDTKGFVVATVEVEEWGGRPLDVVSVHLDPVASPVRRRQIHRMIDALAERGRDLVVLGDLNCCWRRDPRAMDLLTRTLDLVAYDAESVIPTFPSNRPRRRLDWILISSSLRFHGYHTVAADLSDHLGVVADLEHRGA